MSQAKPYDIRAPLNAKTLEDINANFDVLFRALKSAGGGVVGEDGADGTPGADGTDGTNGTPGADGTDGTNGTPGADGTNGTDGAPGTDGADGAPGTDGAPGVDGGAIEVVADETAVEAYATPALGLMLYAVSPGAIYVCTNLGG